MRVIRKGPSNTTYRRIACKKCQSLLEVSESDGVLKYDNRDGNAYVFKCPECQTENWVAVSHFKTKPSAEGH